MKNRNIPYYAAALLMAAGLSTSMVSCVDTDEPESIAQLRNAKAEEVRAKASLLNAQASEVLANIDINKSAAALADKAAELNNAYQELVNAKKKADDDLAMAKNQIELDSIKAVKDSILAVAKINAQIEVLKAKTALDTAKINAQRDITKKQNDILKETKKIAVELAKINKWGLDDELKNANQKLADSLADEAKKLKALSNAVKNFLTNREDIQDELDAANDLVDELKANKDEFEAAIAQNNLADWLDKYWELQDIIDKNEPTQNSLTYQMEEKLDELNAVYDEALKTNLSDQEKAEYEVSIEIGSEELEGLLDLTATTNLKIEDGILQYKNADTKTLTYGYESEAKDSLVAKDVLEDDYKKLSSQLTTIISDLKQNVEKVKFDKEKYGKTQTDWAKDALDPKKGSEYKAWEDAKTAYNKADADKTKDGSAYQALAKACNEFFGVGFATPSDESDDKYLDFIITTTLPSYEDVLDYFGGDKKTADDFYYKCGSVFANAKNIQFTNDQYNKYELALKSAQTLKKTLDDCDFGKAKLDEAEAKDAALWTEEAQAIQDEIDALQDQLDKLTPTVQNAKDLQATILGFAIKANLAFIDDKSTPKEDDDELVFNDVYFAGKDPLDPTKLSDKDFKDAYDFTVNLYNENIKDAEDDAAALKKLLDAFDTKGKEGNVIDFDNGCADLEEFFGTTEWATMIKKVTDAQDEYEKAQNRTKNAQDAYDLLKSVYVVEQ